MKRFEIIIILDGLRNPRKSQYFWPPGGQIICPLKISAASQLVVG